VGLDVAPGAGVDVTTGAGLDLDATPGAKFDVRFDVATGTGSSACSASSTNLLNMRRKLSILEIC